MFSKSKEKINVLGHRLVLARKSVGYTQKKIAGMLGVAEQTMNNYENSKRIPDAELVNKIVGITGCNPGWLLTGEGSMEAGEGEKKGVFDFRSPEKRAVDKNLQKFIDAVHYIFDQGSTPQRRELMGTIMDLEKELKDEE